MKKFDVIIVGGGPGGSASGKVLADKGKKVLLLDKEKFPRKKLCGGMITKKAVALLKDVYGDFNIDDVIDSSYNSAGIYKFGEGKVSVYSNNQKKTYFVNRIYFDNYFLNKSKKAGCEVLEGERVLHVLAMQEKQCKIITESGKEFLCDYVVGADGANSVVRKAITKKNNKSQKSIAIETEVNYEDLICFQKENKIFPQVYFGIINYGYGWVFPKKNKVIIGIGGLVNKNKDNIKNIFDNFLESLLKKDIQKKKYLIAGFPVPFQNYTKNFAKNNILLVGDAAGLIEPVTGEGIYYAILSGKIAAESIFLGGNDVAERYAKMIHKLIGRFLNQAYIAKYIFFSPIVLWFALRKMRKNAKYCKYYIDVLAGELDYCGYTKAVISDRGKYISE